jgi:hypothetical protein
MIGLSRENEAQVFQDMVEQCVLAREIVFDWTWSPHTVTMESSRNIGRQIIPHFRQEIRWAQGTPPLLGCGER